MILAEGDSDRKDADGNKLRYFDVAVESRILVESMKSVSAGAVKKRGRKISPSRVGGITDHQGGRGGLGTSALMGWDDILIGVAISLAAGLLIEGGKALLGGDDDEDGQDCYDPDSDSFYRC
jgi:hypothetical protein